MRLLSTGIVTAALVAGLAGSVTAYRSATDVEAAAAPTTPAVVEETAAPSLEARPQRQVRVRWAPCTPPARLRDGVCVTEVVKTVVLPPSPPSPSPSPRVAAVAGTGAASVGDGDDDDEGYEDHDGDDDQEDGDHEDGDHEDGDHEDDDHEDDDEDDD